MKIYDPKTTNSIFRDVNLLKYHLLLLEEIQKTNTNSEYDPLINGGVHMLMALDNLAGDSVRILTALQKPILIKLHLKVFDRIKLGTYQSCTDFVQILLDPDNFYLEQLKQVSQQCLGQLSIEQIQSIDYRSKMYLLQAMIFKLENRLVESSNMIHNALLCNPFDDLFNSLILFVNHSQFHDTLCAELIKNIQNNSFNFIDLTPPIIMTDLKFLKQNDRLRMLRKYEQGVIKHLAEKDSVQAALSYIDLNMAVSGDLTSYIHNLILACLYFYKSMALPHKQLSELFAYRSIIFDISITVFLITRHYLPIYMQMYTYKLLYALILRSSEAFRNRLFSTTTQGSMVLLQKKATITELILTDSHEAIIEELLKSIDKTSRLTPFIYVPTSTAYNMVYLNYVGNEFLSDYLKTMSYTNSTFRYYFFEGIWKGWITDENFEDERFECMLAFLSERQWTMKHVENWLNWSLVPRTNDGWLLSTSQRLQLREPAYSKVIGITLNGDTGEIDFLFGQANKNEQNLFDMSDVMDILRNGIISAIFTLDPPSTEFHSHPFQEMKYLPRRLSCARNYLQTLLHTDYLLKMITTGTEICAQCPFEMRSAEEHLMPRLPMHIRDKLQVFFEEKQETFVVDNIHRFWIQAGVVSYEQRDHRGFFGFGRVNENIQKYYISEDLPMYVRKHRMRYDEKGNLIDDTRDVESDQSIEAEFARIFTQYYDEIGQCFPEFLRLKELLKLSALAMFIQAHYEGMRRMISTIENDTNVDTFLTKIKSVVGYFPTGNDEADKKILSQLSDTLCKQFFCKKNELRSYLIGFLSRNRQVDLTQFLKHSLIEHKTKLKKTIDRLGIYIRSDHPEDAKVDEEGLSNVKSECPWVPAVFARQINSNIKVYGGVNNTLHLEEKKVDSSRSYKTIDAVKAFDKVTKSRQQPARENQDIKGNNNFSLP